MDKNVFAPVTVGSVLYLLDQNDLMLKFIKKISTGEWSAMPYLQREADMIIANLGRENELSIF